MLCTTEEVQWIDQFSSTKNKANLFKRLLLTIDRVIRLMKWMMKWIQCFSLVEKACESSASIMEPEKKLRSASDEQSKRERHKHRRKFATHGLALTCTAVTKRFFGNPY